MTDPLIQTVTLCEFAQEKPPLTKATGSFHSIFLFVLNCLQTMASSWFVLFHLYHIIWQKCWWDQVLGHCTVSYAQSGFKDDVYLYHPPYALVNNTLGFHDELCKSWTWAAIINKLPHYIKNPPHFPGSALLAASVFSWLGEPLAKPFTRKADLPRSPKLYAIICEMRRQSPTHWKAQQWQLTANVDPVLTE